MANFQYYFIFIVLSLIPTFLLKSFITKLISTTSTAHRRLLNLPPSPPSLPLIGHFHHINTPLHECFQTISTKYGSIVYLRFGASRQLLVSSASAAADIFRTNDVSFAYRQEYSDADKLPLVASSFANAPLGDYWRFMKKLCVTELLGPRPLEALRGVRREEVRRFLQKLVESAGRNEAVDVGAEMTKLTNNIICRMVMSTRCSEKDDEAEECRALVKEAFEFSVKLGIGEMLGPFKGLCFWLYGRQAIDVSRRYDELLERIIKEHEERRMAENGEKQDHKDLMDILLDFHHDDKAEMKITRTQIKSFVMDLFVAGTDTSSTTMQWALAELLNHPNVFNKVREEIKSVAGDSRLVEETDIPNLPYLQAVLKESLRLHPAATLVPRECREHCKIEGFDIPTNTGVLINVHAIMRDPNIWDHPNEFQPERFLISTKNHYEHEKETGGQNFGFGYYPFGGGRRKCPGMPLALNIVSSAVGAMVQCFDWKIDGDGNGGRINMEVGNGWILSMAHPFTCTPVIHFNPFAAS